jgi:hypothetical protein
MPIYELNAQFTYTGVHMTQRETVPSMETTIYNYRLMKRVQHTPYIMFFYSGLILLLLAIDISEGFWWFFILSSLIMLGLHFLMVRVYFYFTVGGSMRGWSFQWGLPWYGILPEGHASIRLVQKVQLHLFWSTFIFLGVLYPWINSMFWVNLLVFHLWVMLPRLLILLLFRPFRKNGLIRISRNDTSCYLP